MQRSRGSADAVAAAAAAATVAPLLTLKRAAQKAHTLARLSRAMELYERALAAAELVALPHDSLVIASLLEELRMTHVIASDAHASSPAAAVRMALTLRLLHLLHARWQAGTLFSPTAEEMAYLLEDEYPKLPAQMCGAFFYIGVANIVVQLQRFQTSCTPAEAGARAREIYGALRAALETDARGMMLEREPRTGVVHVSSVVHDLVTFALSDEAGMLFRMRATCGMSPAEETALRQLAERNKETAHHAHQQLPKEADEVISEYRQAAGADAARHGLRRCALPACDAQEPHPKFFKLCGRCRGAAYCCAAHSAEDWKRHKRDDGCAAPP
jgi:hypothetical protein